MDYNPWLEKFKLHILNISSNHVTPLEHNIPIPIQPFYDLLFDAACLAEKQKIDPTGLELTIYHFRGVHANHHTTDGIKI